MALQGHPPGEITQRPWRALCESHTRRYDITVGMPPDGGVHGAIVLVCARYGISTGLKRALWHARLRGLRRFVVFLDTTEAEEELIDPAELELREHLSRLGFPGDDAQIVRGVVRKRSGEEPDLAPGPMQALFEKMDEVFQEEAPAPPRAEMLPLQERLEPALRQVVFFRANSNVLLDRAQWQRLSRGEESGPYDAKWRFLSILHQALSGYFDDVPDLITLSREALSWQMRSVPLDLLAHIGTLELLDDLRGWIATDGESFCNAVCYWGYLALAPSLIEAFAARAWPGALIFLFPWTIRRLLVDERSRTLESRWGRHISDQDMERYCAQARRYYEALKKSFGTDRVLVAHGEPFGVRRLGEILRACFRRRGFTGYQERWMTAQTGIVFTEELLERFLEDPKSARFQDGVRYFFEKPIPDFSSQNFLASQGT